MILLLGATGYLGRAFAVELRKRKIPFTPLTRRAVDYTRFDILFNYLHTLKPDFVINAAGYPGHPNIDDYPKRVHEPAHRVAEDLVLLGKQLAGYHVILSCGGAPSRCTHGLVCG